MKKKISALEIGDKFHWGEKIVQLKRIECTYVPTTVFSLFIEVSATIKGIVRCGKDVEIEVVEEER